MKLYLHFGERILESLMYLHSLLGFNKFFGLVRTPLDHHTDVAYFFVGDLSS